MQLHADSSNWLNIKGYWSARPTENTKWAQNRRERIYVAKFVHLNFKSVVLIYFKQTMKSVFSCFDVNVPLTSRLSKPDVEFLRNPSGRPSTSLETKAANASKSNVVAAATGILQIYKYWQLAQLEISPCFHLSAGIAGGRVFALCWQKLSQHLASSR